MLRITILAPLLLLVGCTIVQEVEPLSIAPPEEICIIENASVQRSFLDALVTSVQARGYAVSLQASESDTMICPVSVTYSASWLWDLAMYMAYAEITAFEDGLPVGRALYDSRGGGGNTSKFIVAEEKIDELVQALFPQR